MTALPPDPPACRYCAHRARGVYATVIEEFGGPRCERPVATRFDPVEGRRSVPLNVPCRDERAPPNRFRTGTRETCGPTGRFFVALPAPEAT